MTVIQQKATSGLGARGQYLEVVPFLVLVAKVLFLRHRDRGRMLFHECGDTTFWDLEQF
jgi:hypothetical protein